MEVRGAEAMEGDAAYWLASHGFLSLLSYSTQDHQPRDGTMYWVWPDIASILILIWVPKSAYMNKHIASRNLTPVATDWLIKMPTANSWTGQIEVGFWNFLGLGLGKRRKREIYHAGIV